MSVRGILRGILRGAGLMSAGLLIAAGLYGGMVLFIGRNTTTYAPGFSEKKFSEVWLGMSGKEVHALLGEPLSIDPHRPFEIWEYSYPQNYSKGVFKLWDDNDHVVYFALTGVVQHYRGSNKAVKPGMSKDEVTAELGAPKSIGLNRAVRYEYYTLPHTYGTYESRSVGFDEEGTVSAVESSSTFD